MVKISENISVLRKQAGITQEDLANKLNVSNQAVSKWEAGKCCPDIEILPELAAFFGVSIDELLLGECLIKTKLCDKTKDPLILSAIKTAQNKKYHKIKNRTTLFLFSEIIYCFNASSTLFTHRRSKESFFFKKLLF